jgi:mannose-6-phosphate isomerase
MSQIPLYPLRFYPIYEYRPWGGRRLADLLSAPLPADGPIGEAWILSDREDHPSRVADGPLKGRTIRELREQWPGEFQGKHGDRFPLLLKFLDASGQLSVQVHPSDAQTKYLPPGGSGKTEAWVVLEVAPRARIFGGLVAGTTPDTLRRAVANRRVADQLASFTPTVGDGVFLPAGTVHSLSDGVVVFEVQQNSDVTFRLYDWDRIDAKTGRPRALHVEEALACIDYTQGVVSPVTPVVVVETLVRCESLFQCPQFLLWRHRGDAPFTVGADGSLRALVCVEGAGQLHHRDAAYAIGKGDVLLLPRIVGKCMCHPQVCMTLLEIAVPE